MSANKELMGATVDYAKTRAVQKDMRELITAVATVVLLAGLAETTK
jgi:hypothetical protein